MRQVKVVNHHRPLPAPLSVTYCETFGCRLRGLMFRRALPADGGILLVQPRDSRLDSAIHMLGVWVDLGVIWINAAHCVVDVRLARRWRPLYIPRRPARFVLEISPARLDEFQSGDEVTFEEVAVR